MAMISSRLHPEMAVQKEVAGRSLWVDARHRFMRNRAAVVSLILLAVITFFCFAVPYMGLRAQDEINWDKISAPPTWWPTADPVAPLPPTPSSPGANSGAADKQNPSQETASPDALPSDPSAGAGTEFDLSQYQQAQEAENAQEEGADTDATGSEQSAGAVQPDRHAALPYLFGTDVNGRDLFVRTLSGGRVSLTVAFVATLVSLVIGVLWGATAGFAGGTIDSMMMRFVDILYSIPFVFFVIMLTVVFGAHIVLIYIAIGAISWLDMARIVRGQTISLKRKEFIEAAHASGVSNWRIITRHIIPNCLGPVVVYMMLTVPTVMLTESFISFLGMGVQEPQSSWGTLISEGTRGMETAPWQVLFPGLTLAVTLLCLNFIGDGLRDALDPKDR